MSATLAFRRAFPRSSFRHAPWLHGLRLAWIVPCLLTSVISAQSPASTKGDADKLVAVWPDSPPAWDEPADAEVDKTKDSDNHIAGRRLMRISNVHDVQLHVYEAHDASGNPSQSMVVICPGGGFNILAWDLEGTEVAQQLQAAGVSAAVLKYRVPTRQMAPAWTPVVQDAQRAIALIRAGQVVDTIPKHVGLMGFSAGGKATVHTATHPGRAYDSVDQYDESIKRPDFACLIYPAWIVQDDTPEKLRDGIEVDQQTPPMFFAHADNDPHQVLNSVVLFEKLHAAGVPAALHVFTGSGHGFGAREDGRADDLWPELCIRWINDNGWLAK